MPRQTTCWSRKCAANRADSLALCSRSITKISSAHSTSSGVSGFSASWFRPADEQSRPGCQRPPKVVPWSAQLGGLFGRKPGVHYRAHVLSPRVGCLHPYCLSWSRLIRLRKPAKNPPSTSKIATRIETLGSPSTGIERNCVTSSSNAKTTRIMYRPQLHATIARW